MSVRRSGKYRIPFYFNEQPLLLHVTKYTTCDDVIEMILQREGVAFLTSSFVMCEQTTCIERQLSGRSLVVKVWRSWGCEASNMKFVIRRKHSYSPQKVASLKFKDQSTEGSIDALFVDRRMKQKFKHVDNKCKPKDRRKTMATSDLRNITMSPKYPQTLSKDAVTKRPDSKKGNKSFVFSRFFNDLKNANRRVKKRLSLSTRKHDDRTDASTDACLGFDRSSDVNITLSSTLHERCQFAWESNSLSDTDSDISDDFSPAESVKWFDAEESGVTTSLDTAFVKVRHDSDTDEGIDVTSVTSADLDTAFVGSFESNRKSFSKLPGYDISNDVNDFERNISDDDYLKELFGCHGNVCEDDEMDSFMRSRLDSF